MSDKQSELSPKFSEEIDPQALGSSSERPNFVPLGSMPLEKVNQAEARQTAKVGSVFSQRRRNKTTDHEQLDHLKPHQVTHHYVTSAHTILSDRHISPYDAKQLFNDLKERFQARSPAT